MGEVNGVPTLMFPLPVLYETLGPDLASHLGSLARDYRTPAYYGLSDLIVAPCSGVIERRRSLVNGEIYLRSDGPVCLASGRVQNAGVLITFIHCVDHLVHTGEHVKVGQPLATVGGLYHGMRDFYSPHLHLELSSGLAPARQTPNHYGVYCTSHQLDISEMALGNDVRYEYTSTPFRRRVDVERSVK